MPQTQGHNEQIVNVQKTDNLLINYIKIGGIVLILLIVVGASLYFIESRSNRLSGESDQFTVRLGWVHQAQFAGMYVAKEKGFYADANIEVELLPLDPKIGQGEELTMGSVDATVMEAHQLLTDIDKGFALQVVAAIYQINPHVLAARVDSGIVGPEDFSNKIVGYSGGLGEGDALFQAFVEDVSNAESITYIELGFDTVDDFKNNRADIIDVYRIDQPYLAEREGIPLTIIPLDAYGFSTYGDVLVMHQDLVTNNKDLAKRFVRATLQGWEYALSNPQEAATITLQYTEGNYADREYQEHIMFESIPLVRGNTPRLGQMELVPWSTLYESMKRAGVLEKNFNVRDIYTNEFIQ